MSIESDFFFNIPEEYNIERFINSLRENLAINFPDINEYGVYSGNCLGMFMSFDPKHDLDDDGEFVVSEYSSSIGITGYAGNGQIRIIQLHQLINIALAICYHFEIDGLVTHEISERVVHLGFHKSKQCLWNFDEKIEITEYSLLRKTFEHGVKY